MLDLREAVARLQEVLPAAPSELIFRYGRRSVDDVQHVASAIDTILFGAVATIQGLEGQGTRETAAAVGARAVAVEMLVELLAEAAERARATQSQLRVALPRASRVFGPSASSGPFH